VTAEENSVTCPHEYFLFNENISAPEWLISAIETLPELDRELIRHIFWQEFTQAEIAQRLNISQPCVSQRRDRVLTNLRVVLGKYGMSPLVSF
jgi:RNA polymerase sigma factor (sigma-70 family)